MTFWLALVILLANGVGVFGLKLLVVWQLPQGMKFRYLAVWYGAGFLTFGVALLWHRVRLHRKELFLGALMALGSVGGQSAMATALNAGIPGSVVFPISTGGSLVLVGLAGRLFFSERMNRTSAAGIGIGLIAVILLGLS